MAKVKPVLWVGACVVVLTGCGGQNDRQTKGSGNTLPTWTETASAPDVIERYGRSYLRRDLWSPEEFERILAEARPTDEPPTAAHIAAALRAHVFANGVYYIEAEPNLELGAAVLRGENAHASTPPGIPREGRTIIGSDDRVHSTTSQSYPNRTVAFQESGCTATKVGRYTMVTAAHCIYDNSLDDFECSGGGTLNHNCVGGYPNWRFGTDDSTGFGSFFGATAVGGA